MRILFVLVFMACISACSLPLGNLHALSLVKVRASNMHENDLGKHLTKIVSLNKDLDTLVVLLENGIYKVSSPVILTDFEGYLKIFGGTNTKLILSSSFINVRGFSKNIHLDRIANRNSPKINLKERDLPVGSLIVLTSNDTVETAWNYMQADVGRVGQVEGNQYVLESTLNFSYAPSTSDLVAFRPAGVCLKNLRFDLRENVAVLIAHGISLVMNNCEIVNQTVQNIQSCVNLYNCENIQILDCTIRGKITYGFLMNNCRNVNVNNIKSKECLYPIVPAYWSSDIKVDGFTGNGSLIDAHPSFNVSYKNVVTKNGESYWNCRALGVELQNCSFHMLPGIKDKSIYLGVVALADRYAYLYEEYDVHCKNVTWMYEDQVFNGLHVHKC
ncbi:MAG: hypothetical protein ABIQ11_12325, partial [Saprospiraceae bacterium]